MVIITVGFGSHLREVFATSKEDVKTKMERKCDILDCSLSANFSEESLIVLII